MKRILVIAAGYPSEKSFSGAFHRDQIELIAQAGYAVTVVAPTPWVPEFLGSLSERWSKYITEPKYSIEGSIQIIRPRYLAIPKEMSLSFPDIMQFISVFNLRLPRPDLIQGFYGFPNGGAVRLMAKYWNVPYFIGLLGDDVNLYPHLRSRNLRVLNSVVQDAAIAFANGPSLTQEATRITGRKISNIPIGVNYQSFLNLTSPDDARVRLGLPRDKNLVLYVGSLIPTKGINEFLNALESLNLNNTIAVFIGDGPMRELVEDKPNTICLGVRKPKEIALAMRAANLLVHPSYSEGLPTVIVEAGFAKLPVITTDARGCLDIGKDKRAVIVPTHDYRALATAIEYALENPQLMKENAERMFCHVKDNYSLVTNTKLLIDQYHKYTCN